MDVSSASTSDYTHFIKSLTNENNLDTSKVGCRLQVIISGGGLSGLATAIALRQNNHHVTVLEAGTGEQSGGFGLQIAPNFTRVLYRLGLKDGLEKLAVFPSYVAMRRWITGDLIGKFELRELDGRFGSPYIQMHRGDLHGVMMQRARDLGVTIRTCCRVTHYDLDAASVELSSGQTISSDLLVVADGLKSVSRSQLDATAAPESAPSSGPPLAVYRTSLNTAVLRSQPKIAWLCEDSQGQCWVGPNSHVVLYPMSANKAMTLTLTMPFCASADKPDYRQELTSILAEWDPTIHHLLAAGDEFVKWPMPWAEELPTMIGSSGRTVIVGDAAHYMTPWLGQGAAMCAEDALMLARVLSGVADMADIPFALRMYDELRRPRTRAVRAMALRNRDALHLEDGDAQQKRDAISKEYMTAKEPESRHPFVWSDPEVQDIIFGYDVENDVRQAASEALRKHKEPAK